VAVPVLAVAAVGAKIMLMVQDVDAASDELHVVPDCEKPAPPTELLRPVREVVLLFVTVITCVELIVFVTWLPNAIAAGDTVATPTPVPVSATI